MDDPEAGLMRMLYEEHGQPLWRYAVRLTAIQHGQRMWCRKRCCAHGSIQKSPTVTGRHVPGCSPWRRNMIIDERRSARFRSETGTPDPEKTYDRAGPDEVDSALDRMLLSGALAQLSPDHRAVISRSYYQGWTTAQIAADLDIAEGTVKSRLHYAVRALRL